MPRNEIAVVGLIAKITFRPVHCRLLYTKSISTLKSS